MTKIEFFIEKQHQITNTAITFSGCCQASRLPPGPAAGGSAAGCQQQADQTQVDGAALVVLIDILKFPIIEILSDER